MAATSDWARSQRTAGGTAISPSRGRLVIVEPLAAERGGHPHQSLPLLARAAADAGRPVTLVAVDGVDPEIRESLQRYGVEIVTAIPRMGAAGIMLAISRALTRIADIAQERTPQRSLPWQLDLYARCLAEAGSLRAARARHPAGSPPDTAVVLTANLTFHACAAALSGQPHVRYLHDISRTESRAVRALEWALAAWLDKTWIFCTTPTVDAALRAQYPLANTVVQTFALSDSAARPEHSDQDDPRYELGLPARPSVVGSLIGGWWKVKDTTTVVRALARVTCPFTLLVAGYRMDRRLLDEMSANERVSIRVIDRPLSSAELRCVYAASDFTIVSREAGGKESGVALDAISRGIPLVVSDHDEGLARILRGEPWARVFSRGDEASLARAIDEACATGLPRPPSEATAQVGMVPAEAMIDAFDRVVGGR